MPTRPSAGAGEVLSRRALNRALLARQHLLHRVEMPAIDMIDHLVGMQAQAPYSPYVGLWARLEPFQHAELAQLLTDRQVVRIALMRSTIHLVSARDCLAMRSLFQTVIDRGLKGAYGKRLVGLDLAEIAAQSRVLLEEQPRMLAELGALLAERWPDRDPQALGNVARTLLPLVQIPPRGVWGVGGQAIHATAETWLGRPLETAPVLDIMVLRYLAAFGPASVKDVQTWSGLTRLRDVVEQLRPQLRSFRDEQGVELFDLPDAPRPDPETPAPVRFLPEFDNVFLSHADRSRVLDEEQRQRILANPNGLVPGGASVDGFFCGLWIIRKQRSSATLTIELFAQLAQQDCDALVEEGARLLKFVAAEAQTHDIRFATLPMP